MYNPLQPQNEPSPAIATTQMRTNFTQFNNIFGNNHVSLNDSNQGKHNSVIFQEQSSDPGAIDYDSVYSKSVTTAAGTSSEMFVQVPQFLPNSQPNLPQQLTYNSIIKTGAPITYAQTFLPGGYVFYFGIITSVPQTITLTPTPSKIVCAIAQPNQFAGSGAPFDVETQVLTANTFRITSSSATGSYTFRWMAIGLQ